MDKMGDNFRLGKNFNGLEIKLGIPALITWMLTVTSSLSTTVHHFHQQLNPG